MGFMKDMDIRIRSGGDDAVAAACELLPRWISVDDQLPPETTVVLGWTNRVVFSFRRDGGWVDTLYGWHLPNGPSHWMPLPAPPSP